MAEQTSKGLPSQLLVLVYSGHGAPLSLRVHVRRTLLLVVAVSIGVGCLILGSLLFLREVEINRNLSDRLLEYRVNDRLAAQMPALEKISPLLYVPEATRTITETAPADLPEDTRTEVAPAAPSAQTKKVAGQAQLGEVATECQHESCEIKISLLPSSANSTEGQMLVILETEVPKIGTAAASGNIHKKFFVYPGYKMLEEISADSIGSLEGRPFKFSRVLQTTLEFKLGALLRPLAVNVYLYDSEHNLIHHDRRAIETE